MTTLDFELEIGPGTDGIYPVIARTPSGETTATFRWSFTPVEFDQQLAMIKDKVLASSAVTRRAPARDEHRVRELGQELFEALITDDIRALYVASGQRAREDADVLRLMLRVHPPELARLPWEFLFDPRQQDYLGLTLPLVRSPHALDTRQEQQRLQAGLARLPEGLVELTWVGGQTYNDLEDTLDQGPWQVFHFIGHGGYDSGVEEGTLALAGETGRTQMVGAEDISRLLAEHHPLRLVILNACDTGRGSGLDAFSSIAAALIRRGIPAVVAMQFEITDSAAILFAQTFYQNVAKHRPVDECVMRARRAIRRNKNAFSPDGHRIATASSDTIARIWVLTDDG